MRATIRSRARSASSIVGCTPSRRGMVAKGSSVITAARSQQRPVGSATAPTQTPSARIPSSAYSGLTAETRAPATTPASTAVPAKAAHRGGRASRHCSVRIMATLPLLRARRSAYPLFQQLEVQALVLLGDGVPGKALAQLGRFQPQPAA